jgi:FtsZ-binding cell division protein ZapB
MGEDRSKELAIKNRAQKDFPEFTDSVDGLSVGDLESYMLIMAKYRDEVDLSKQKDEELARLKEQIKDIQAPYNDALKALKTKMAYLGVLIQEKKGDGV